MDTFKTFAPDDPHGTEHTLAPFFIAVAINRRLACGAPKPVVICPKSPDCFIFDPGNFWDGPTHVYYDEAIGHFSFAGWEGRQRFPLIGPLQ